MWDRPGQARPGTSWVGSDRDPMILDSLAQPSQEEAGPSSRLGPGWAELRQDLAGLAGRQAGYGGEVGRPARLSRPAAQEAGKWKKNKI